MDLYIAILNEDQTHRISGPVSNKYIILCYFACIKKKKETRDIFSSFERNVYVKDVILIS